MTPLPPGLLADILARPDDDELRLVCADFWEDHGDAERAEFVRVQVAFARDFDDHEFAPRGEPLRKRIGELWDRGTDAGGWLELPAHWGIPYWKRGFVHGLQLSAADWLAHADAILAAQPVREVTLTTWPLMDGKAIHGGPAGYRLRGRQRIHFPEAKQLNDALREIVHAEWPDITFTMPPDPADAFQHITGADVLSHTLDVWGQPPGSI